MRSPGFLTAPSDRVHLQKDPLTGEDHERHRLPLNWRHHVHEMGYGPFFHGKKALEKLGLWKE